MENSGKGTKMPIIELDQVPKTAFSGGATYQTLVGDDAGSTPIRVGVQISPSGYSTGTHSHPYMEVVTVVAGTGEAWVEGQPGTTPIGPGVTMVLPPNVRAHPQRPAILRLPIGGPSQRPASQASWRRKSAHRCGNFTVCRGECCYLGACSPSRAGFGPRLPSGRHGGPQRVRGNGVRRDTDSHG